jgi:predicted transcriptional regulator of viral defense system
VQLKKKVIIEIPGKAMKEEEEFFLHRKISNLHPTSFQQTGYYSEWREIFQPHGDGDFFGLVGTWASLA